MIKIYFKKIIKNIKNNAQIKRLIKNGKNIYNK